MISFRRFQDRNRKRMARAVFECGPLVTAHLRLGVAEADDIRHLGLTFGQGARLVESDRRYLAHDLAERHFTLQRQAAAGAGGTKLPQLPRGSRLRGRRAADER